MPTINYKTFISIKVESAMYLEFQFIIPKCKSTHIKQNVNINMRKEWDYTKKQITFNLTSLCVLQSISALEIQLL